MERCLQRPEEGIESVETFLFSVSHLMWYWECQALFKSSVQAETFLKLQFKFIMCVSVFMWRSEACTNVVFITFPCLSFSLHLELTNSARLAGQQGPCIPPAATLVLGLQLQPPHSAFCMYTRDQTRVPVMRHLNSTFFPPSLERAM